MEDDAKRKEYVLNDQGKVYVGAFRRSRGRPWAFGQFDDVVLPVAMYILQTSRVADAERGNAVKVVRGISAGVGLAKLSLNIGRPYPSPRFSTCQWGHAFFILLISVHSHNKAT